jgi:hypothetical protein
MHSFYDPYFSSRRFSLLISPLRASGCGIGIESGGMPNRGQSGKEEKDNRSRREPFAGLAVKFRTFFNHLSFQRRKTQREKRRVGKRLR